MTAWPEAGPGGPAGMAELLARRAEEEWFGEEASLPLVELVGRYLPYPTCRDELGFASKAEYDLALLELLDDSHLLLPDDPVLRRAVEEELASAEPSLRALAPLEGVGLRPGPGLQRPSRGPAPRAFALGEDVASAAGPAADVASRDVASPNVAPRENGPRREVAPREEESDACRVCGRDLPDRDGIRFCPWCGEDRAEPRCGACGEPLEAAWRYCPGCGEATVRGREGIPPPDRHPTDRKGGPDAVR